MRAKHFFARPGATGGANAGAAAEVVGLLGIAPRASAALPRVEGVNRTRLVRGAASLIVVVGIGMNEINDYQLIHIPNLRNHIHINTFSFCAAHRQSFFHVKASKINKVEEVSLY